MARFGFCGPTYQALSSVADAELAMNLYYEPIESQNGRSAAMLVQTDGLEIYIGDSEPFTSTDGLLGIYTFNGRTFYVGYSGIVVTLYEIVAGAWVSRGAIGGIITVPTDPVVWAANPSYIVFTAGGSGLIYTFELATNTLNGVTLSAGNAISVKYLDGFFIAVIENSNTIQISNLGDPTTWQAINVATTEAIPDQIVAMEVTQETLWFFGERGSVPYYNSGALFPFIPVPGTFVNEGAIAPFGVSKLDNTILWIGGNIDEGIGVAWRLNGYTPQRISTIAVETAWQSYSTIADAISYTYQTRGHKFWHIYFPTANASWRYDIMTQMWHQVGFWDSETGVYNAHPTRAHTFAFGLHLFVGLSPDIIYQGSDSYATFDTYVPAEGGVVNNPIRPCRRAPYVAKEHEPIFIRRLEVLAQVGSGPNVAAPSTSPNTLNLADSTGAVWTITIADNGTISVLAAAAGVVASNSPVLADNVNQTTFWQLTVAPITGALSGTQVTIGAARTAIFQMATSGTFLQSGLESNQAGVITSALPQQYYRAPQLDLRSSKDSGNTWSDTKSASLGKVGEYTARCIWDRLGSSRNWVPEVSCSDPIALRIVDAYVNADGAQFKPTERLAATLGKSA